MGEQGDLFRHYVTDADRAAAFARLCKIMRDEVGDSKLFDAFCRFHLRYPDVLRLAERFTREIARRHAHYGIGAIWERLRWEAATTAQFDEEGFRLNNNHRAYYARLLELLYPDLALRQFFRSRQLGPRGTQHRAPDAEVPPL